MSPIYRMVDGLDSLEKNDVVFSHGYELLRRKKVLLLFGEGVTDEEFMRRVKPLKKGSMRIALGAEAKFGFQLGVKIICVGINYSDPRKFRSDLIINFSKPIDLGNYKNLFLEHNNKAMLELNKDISIKLKEQIIHIENKENLEFFEQMLILSRKGINNDHYDNKISLEKRWLFTKGLEEKLNNSPNNSLDEIKEKAKIYFLKLKESGMEDSQNFHKPGAASPFLFYMVLTFPIFIFGLVTNFIPVWLAVFYSRKISKRPVFWSGTDMAFSVIALPVYYLALILSANYFFPLYLPLYLLFILLMVPCGIFAFDYFKKVKSFIARKNQVSNLKNQKREIEALESQRKNLTEEIEKLGA